MPQNPEIEAFFRRVDGLKKEYGYEDERDEGLNGAGDKTTPQKSIKGILKGVVDNKPAKFMLGTAGFAIAVKDVDSEDLQSVANPFDVGGGEHDSEALRIFNNIQAAIIAVALAALVLKLISAAVEIKDLNKDKDEVKYQPDKNANKPDTSSYTPEPNVSKAVETELERLEKAKHNNQSIPNTPTAGRKNSLKDAFTDVKTGSHNPTSVQKSAEKIEQTRGDQGDMNK